MRRYEYVRRDQQLEKERAQQVRANRKHKRQQDQAAEADDVKRQKSPAQEAQPEPIAAAQTHTVRFVTRGAHVELAKPAQSSANASGEEAMVEAKAVQACTWVQVTIYEGRKHQVFDFPSRGALCARRHTVQRSANARVLFHH